jgi:long-chain acyl-CoA synthetase
VSVPVLTDFIPGQIKTIAEHAGISAICVTSLMAPKVSGIDPAIPRILLDSMGYPSRADIMVAILGVSKRMELREPCREERGPVRSEGDLASIIYTSGTTGTSKGVMLSHRNLISCARASRSLMKIFPRDRLISVIPLAHTYECTLGLLAVLMNGASITYLDKPPSPVVLLPAIQAIRPTAMVTVPLFIEKIYRQKIASALAASPLYRFPPTRPLALFLAGRRLMSAFGGLLRFFGIGGAPLAADVEEFLRKVKFPYAPGYGLTEASPLLAGTGPYRFAFRSAGAVLKGMELRISNEGEIQARGPNIMMGYYRDKEGSAAAFTPDGWLKTGDLGYIDSRGQVFIKGRLKAMILGPSGENIYPEEIEGLLTSSGFVEDALVYSGEKGEVLAQVILSEKANEKTCDTGLEELKRRVNEKLAAFSRLSSIEVRKEPFEKTPTRKIKRFLYQS